MVASCVSSRTVFSPSPQGTTILTVLKLTVTFISPFSPSPSREYHRANTLVLNAIWNWMDLVNVLGLRAFWNCFFKVWPGCDSQFSWMFTHSIGHSLRTSHSLIFVRQIAQYFWCTPFIFKTIFLRILPSDIEAVFYVFQHKTQYFQRTSAHVWFGCKRWRIAFSCQRRQAREALDRTSTLKGILPARQRLLRIKPLQISGPCISLVHTMHIRRGFLYF